MTARFPSSAMGERKVQAPESRTRTTRQASPRRPDVIVDFIFDNGLFFISVENIGDQPALKVTTTFDQKIIGLHGSREISGLPLFRLIEFLAPHKSIKTLLDSSAAYFNRHDPTRISAHIAYRDSSRQRYATTIHHDLDIYKDISYLPNSREPVINEEEQYGRPPR